MSCLVNKGNKAPALARINIPLPSKMALQHRFLIPHTVRKTINHHQPICQHHPVLGLETQYICGDCDLGLQDCRCGAGGEESEDVPKPLVGEEESEADAVDDRAGVGWMTEVGVGPRLN